MQVNFKICNLDFKEFIVFAGEEGREAAEKEAFS